VSDVLDLPRPLGFVLGGGGSFGAGQVGMLQALAERGVTPDLVVGTSVGSLNGAVVARDPATAADRLTRLWAQMTRAAVFPGSLLGQARRLQRTRTSLFPNTGLAGVVASVLGDRPSFADLQLPLGVLTTDVGTSRPHVITAGPLLPALLASAAIPAVYPPVQHDGRLLYDGGLVANVPMRQAVALGARSLVVLDCSFPGHVPPVPRTAAEAVLYSLFVGFRTQAVLEAPIVAAEVPVVYLPGAAVHRMSPLDFTHSVALAEEAYASARAFLASLIVRGPGLYGAPDLNVGVAPTAPGPGR
jgi:NTE family protein